MPGVEIPPKDLHLIAHHYSENTQIYVTRVSLMDKMIPDVPWGQMPEAPVSRRKLFLERSGKPESHLLAFDKTSLGE